MGLVGNPLDTCTHPYSMASTAARLRHSQISIRPRWRRALTSGGSGSAGGRCFAQPHCAHAVVPPRCTVAASFFVL